MPSTFVELFVTGSQEHSYDTRTVSTYRPHVCHTNFKQFTILYLDPKIWNSLPNITGSSSFPTYVQVSFIEIILT